jgi:hypothetical protein
MSSVSTSQETYCIFATKPNRLMPLRKQSLFIVRTIRNTQIQFVPHRKHFIFATKSNRLMLFRETAAVYYENHTEHTGTIRTSQETFHLRYRVQPINAVKETTPVYFMRQMKHK